MEKNSRLFGNISIAVSGVAALLGLGYWSITRTFDVYVQIALGLFIIGLALFVYFDPDRTRSLVTGRQARYGSNALLLFVAFFASVATINYLVYRNAQDWGLRWDLTADQERTLSPETLNALELVAELDAPVIARAFYSIDNVSQERARELLDDYKFYAKGNLAYEVIDPLLNPIEAEQAGVTAGGGILFSYAGTSQLVTTLSEQAFTSALVALLNPNDKAVYFLTGHGEYSIDESGAGSLSTLGAALGNKNYTVSSLNLILEPSIPQDAAVLVIPGPLQPVTAAEIELIRAFVDGGGSLVIAADASVQTEYIAKDDPVAAYLAEAWGIGLADDIVIEPQVISSLGGLYAASASYGVQDITNDLSQRSLITIFPIARSVSVVNSEAANVFITPLIFTTEEAWGETDIDSINAQTPAFDERDIPGPFPLAVAAENGLTGARLVVFGDSDFLSNDGIGQFGNRDLILNSVDWTAGQENLITLTPRQVTQRLMVSPNENTLLLILIGTVCLIPGLVLLGGVMVWVMRRRQG